MGIGDLMAVNNVIASLVALPEVTDNLSLKLAP